MHQNVSVEAISQEKELIWLEGIDRLDYVRENRYECAGAITSFDGPPTTFGETPPGYSSIRLVGYTTLRPDAVAPATRRYFTLKGYDRDSEPNGTYAENRPWEAVDPRTVAPGVPGWQTQRAIGYPPEEREDGS
jgi:hypothetical protein